MNGRADLQLTIEERRAFLRDVLAERAAVALAVAGADGYPAVRVVRVANEPDALRFIDEDPPDGAAACVIVERGTTYDDITGVIARGVIRDRRLLLDDVVSFDFAKAVAP